MGKNKGYCIGLFIFLASLINCNAKGEKVPEVRDPIAFYDTTQKQIMLVGRTIGGIPEIWLFNFGNKTWTKMKTKKAPSIVGYTAIYDPVGKQMIIFSGDNTWSLDIEKQEWKKIKTKKSPTARVHHSAIYDTENKQMIIFGGMDINGGSLSDTWIFDIEKKEWKEIKTEKSPPARTKHSAIYDPVNKQMLVFGGGDEHSLRNEIWIFDIKEKEWEKIETKAGPLPCIRERHSAVYDPENEQMLIFGGYGVRNLGDEWLLDLWSFDIKKKTWEEIQTRPEDSLSEGKTDKGPGVIGDYSAVYNNTSKQMLVIGADNPLEMWAYDIESLQDNSAKASLKNLWKRIKPNGTIMITVLDEKEVPVEVVKIEIQNEEKKKMFDGQTNKEGKFEANIEEGRFVVIITKEGYKEQKEEIKVFSARTKKLGIKMEMKNK